MASEEIELNGVCYCGKVKFTVTGKPKTSVLCHCESCRRAHASPLYWSCYVPESQFKWVSGEELVKSSPKKHYLDRKWCQECGTRLIGEMNITPQMYEMFKKTIKDESKMWPVGKYYGVYPGTFQFKEGESLPEAWKAEFHVNSLEAVLPLSVWDDGLAKYTKGKISGDSKLLQPAEYPTEEAKAVDEVSTSCYCGAVKLKVRLKDAPSQSCFCHCTNCKVSHASPIYWVWILPEDRVTIMEGEEDAKGFCADKSAETFARYFCKKCGSRTFNRLVFAEDGFLPKGNYRAVFPATFNTDPAGSLHPKAWHPSFHICTDSALLDLSILNDGRPQISQFPGAPNSTTTVPENRPREPQPNKSE